ncbi:MAG: nitroreductase family protein [Cytophagaceae bacterium]
MIKIPTTKYPVIDLIKDRWSARSFSEKSISENDLKTLVEAASWAFSANNIQPWRYIVIRKENNEVFQAVVNSLMPGNQPWAKNAAAFIICLSVKESEPGKTNAYAEHDLGAANALLLLQARHMDIYGHIMGGFVREALVDRLKIDSNYHPSTVMALGYLGAPDKLIEPFKTRELTPRSRKPIEEISSFMNELP